MEIYENCLGDAIGYNFIQVVQVRVAASFFVRTSEIGSHAILACLSMLPMVLLKGRYMKTFRKSIGVRIKEEAGFIKGEVVEIQIDH
ncbi:RuvB-like protein 2, partial [Tanacetum coccineum]